MLAYPFVAKFCKIIKEAVQLLTRFIACMQFGSIRNKVYDTYPPFFIFTKVIQVLYIVAEMCFVGTA